ncbi:hypothetical protein [Sphingomonas sp. S6]|jgi:hypothetical protein|nr:hypothetical protein [uncultured Sphingomonas sp.]
MPDQNPLHRGPQRRAVPRMLTFIATIVLIAVALVVGFTFAR